MGELLVVAADEDGAGGDATGCVIGQERRGLLVAGVVAGEAELFGIVLGEAPRRLVEPERRWEHAHVADLEDQVEEPARLALPPAQHRVRERQVPVEIAEDRDRERLAVVGHRDGTVAPVASVTMARARGARLRQTERTNSRISFVLLPSSRDVGYLQIGRGATTAPFAVQSWGSTHPAPLPF
jgi:hypothetical protein